MIDFPSNPVDGAIVTAGRKKWQFVAATSTWDLVSTPDQVAADTMVAAQAAAIEAAGHATDAGTSAATAVTSRLAIDNRIYPGTYAVPPSKRPDGSPIQDGDRFCDTSATEYISHSGVWISNHPANLTDSPAFTGTPTAPTPAAADNSAKLATTAFVAGAVAAYAPLASPAFTGSPTAPTQVGGDSTSKLATTSFVAAAVAPLAAKASPAFTGTPTAPTPAQGDSSTKLATTAFVAASNTLYLPAASGDATGVSDYAFIQAALTAARLAGGGTVIGKPGASYVINATLQIGSGTTLQMNGCTITLAANSNCLMLANYSSLNPVSTGAIAGQLQTSAGQATLFADANCAPHLNGIVKKGMTVAIPCAFGAATTTMLVAIITSDFNSATAANLTLSRASPSAIAAGVTGWSIYNRDSRIVVEGGVWDRGTNGTGDTETNHAMRWRGLDGIEVRRVTYLSLGFNNGRYSCLVQDVNGGLFDNITYGLNPYSGAWNLNAGYARDGVHITGPSSDIVVRNIFGFPGDDMVAITTSDYANIAGNYAGDVTKITIEDIHGLTAGQCAVKLMGGPAQNLTRVQVRNVFGNAASSAGLVAVGDDNRQVTTTGGFYDHIVLENILGTMPNNRPLITLLGNLGRITIVNAVFDNAASTALGVVAIGANIYGTAQATTVAQLDLDRFDMRALGTSKAVYVEAGSTVTTLATRNWYGNANPFSLIGGPGTIGSFQQAPRAFLPKTKTANYALQSGDQIILFNGANLTATLPSAVTWGSYGPPLTVKNLNASALTLGATAGSIDGAVSKSLAQYISATLVSDGTNWAIVSTSAAL